MGPKLSQPTLERSVVTSLIAAPSCVGTEARERVGRRRLTSWRSFYFARRDARPLVRPRGAALVATCSFVVLRRCGSFLPWIVCAGIHAPCVLRRAGGSRASFYFRSSDHWRPSRARRVVHIGQSLLILCSIAACELEKTGSPCWTVFAGSQKG